MVKLSQDQSQFKRLEELQKQKEKKEKEFQKQQEEKQKELEELQKSKEKEIKKVDQHLEDAVADLVTREEEESTEEEESEQLPEEVAVSEETPDLEEAISEQNNEDSVKEGDFGPIYEINSSELEQIGDLYGEVRKELESGMPGAAVDKARTMLYALQKKDVYVTEEAHHMIKRDKSTEGDHYVQRLGALMDLVESRTGTEYKSRHAWEE